MKERPYKLKKNNRKGFRLCSTCSHLYPRKEMKNKPKGLVCVYCLKEG